MQINLTLKNPSDLKSVFEKFKDLSASALLVFRREYFEISGFTLDTSFYKKTKIQYKDFFEESEIDIDHPIFCSLWSSIEPIMKYLAQFKSQCQFQIQYEEITQSNILKIVETWTDNASFCYVVQNFFFVDNELRLKYILPKIGNSKSSFSVDEDTLTNLISREENNLYGSFEFSLETLNKIQGLLKLKSTAPALYLKTSDDEEDKVVEWFIPDCFDLSIPAQEIIEDFKFPITPKNFSFIDNESYNVEIIENKHTHLIVMSSTESDTLCFISALLYSGN